MCGRGLSSQGRVWRPAAGVDTCPTSTSTLTYDFQDQFPVIGPLRRNAEGVLDHPGRFFPAFSLGGEKAAKQEPASTFSPTFTSRITPTAGSTASSLRSRPAPIRLEARPISRALMTLT